LLETNHIQKTKTKKIRLDPFLCRLKTPTNLIMRFENKHYLNNSQSTETTDNFQTLSTTLQKMSSREEVMGAEAIECLKFMGWEWTADQGWNEKEEEVSESTNIEIFEDLRREEIAQLEVENHRLRDEFQKTLKISARLEEVGKLREENKELKEENKKLDAENAEMKKNGGFAGDPETAECANAMAWRLTRDKLKKLEAYQELSRDIDNKFSLWWTEAKKLEEENKKLEEENKKLQETVAEQATDLFFIRCESRAGGEQVYECIGYGAEWAEEVKDAMRRTWHHCPVNDVDLDEMFKRYLEWAQIDLSEEEDEEEDE